MKSYTKLFLTFTLIVLCFLGLISSNSNTTFIDYEQDTKTVFSKETDGPLTISIYTHQDLETPSKTNKIYKWIVSGGVDEYYFDPVKKLKCLPSIWQIIIFLIFFTVRAQKS